MKLDELKRLADEATAGPWSEIEGDIFSEDGTTVSENNGRSSGGFDEIDAAFVCAARAAVPELVRRLMRLRELLTTNKIARLSRLSKEAATELLELIHGELKCK